MGNSDMSVDQSQNTSRRVMWSPSASEVKRTSNPEFSPKRVFRGLSTRGPRIRVPLGLGGRRGGSGDPLLLLAWKKHQKEFFPVAEEAFRPVSGSRYHGYECHSVSDRWLAGVSMIEYFNGSINVAKSLTRSSRSGMNFRSNPWNWRRLDRRMIGVDESEKTIDALTFPNQFCRSGTSLQNKSSRWETANRRLTKSKNSDVIDCFTEFICGFSWIEVTLSRRT